MTTESHRPSTGRNVRVKVIRDLVIIAVAGVLSGVIFVILDRQKTFNALLGQFGGFHVHELVFHILVLSVLFAWFSWRRWEEFDRESRGHLETIERLRASRNHFDHVVSSISDIVYVADPTLKTFGATYINTAIEASLGFTPEEWLANPDLWYQQIHEDDRERVIGAFDREIERSDRFAIEYAMWHKDGRHLCWFEDRVTVERDDQGRAVTIYGTMSDITERKRAEKSLQEDRRILEVVDRTLSSFLEPGNVSENFDAVLLNLLELTDSQYGFVNDCRVDDEGKPYMQAVAISNIAWNEETRKFYEENAPSGFKFYDYDGLNAVAVVTGEVVIANDAPNHPRSKGVPKGHPPLNTFLGIPLKRGEKVVGTVGLANREGGYDASLVERLMPFWSALAEVIESLHVEEARKLSESKLQHLAHYDVLTGLLNRASFHDKRDWAVSYAQRNGVKFALLLLDLDHFKDVNDTRGHPIGDALLVAAGERLKIVIRESDIVARLGGDEFAILQLPIKTADEAAIYAQRIIDLLAQPFIIEGHQIHTAVSIGIAVYTPGEADPKQLLTQADTALYRAKEEGRGRYRFHNDGIEEEIRRRVAIREELHEAITDSQFVLYFQPQVNIQTRRLVGVEALVRWNHPQQGILGPDAFIPIAEDSGLLIDIDGWVLREACRQMRAWKDVGLVPEAKVGVNLSPLQFKTSDFEKKVVAILTETGLDPHCLDLEVTERTLAERPEIAADVMKRLALRGVNFSIDDFGTGYSSLQYLKTLPVGKIKVAQEFVRDLMEDGSDASIVSAIIGLGQELGLEVIAEGVETKEQLEFLRGKGCFLIQGHYFARPQPAAELSAWLQREKFELA